MKLQGGPGADGKSVLWRSMASTPPWGADRSSEALCLRSELAGELSLSRTVELMF